jgi:hypothetical protein
MVKCENSIIWCVGVLDPLSRYLYLPWGIKYIHAIYEGSWAGAVSSYGLLISSMMMGRVVGATMSMNQKHSRLHHVPTQFVVSRGIALMLGYAGLCLANRVTILLFCFFSIGFAGGQISVIVQEFSEPSHEKRGGSAMSSPQHGKSNYSSGQNQSASSMRMDALVLAVAALLSGFAFNPSLTVRFPAWKPTVVFLILVSIIIVVYAFNRRHEWIQHRFLRTICAWCSSYQNISSVSGSGVIRQQSSFDRDLEAGGSSEGTNNELESLLASQKDENINEVQLSAGLEIPKEFLEFHSGDIDKARTMYETALRWRHDNRVADILDIPRETFKSVNELYPHAIHGRSRDNCIVVYEQIGQSNPQEIVKRNISPEMMMWHFVLRNEYIFRCISCEPDSSDSDVSKIGVCDEMNINDSNKKAKRDTTTSHSRRRLRLRRQDVWRHSDSSESGSESESSDDDNCVEEPSNLETPSCAQTFVEGSSYGQSSRLAVRAWRYSSSSSLQVLDGTADYYGPYPSSLSWGVVPHYPRWQLMTVLDVKGIGLGQVTVETISFIKQSAEIMDAYYPGKVRRLVICNAPAIFWTVWSYIKGVLPESVQSKIVIISNLSELDEFIDRDQRPAEYGGTDIPLRTAPEYRGFEELYDMWHEHGMFNCDNDIGVKRDKDTGDDSDSNKNWRPNLHIDATVGREGTDNQKTMSSSPRSDASFSTPREYNIDTDSNTISSSKREGSWMSWLNPFAFGSKKHQTPKAYLGVKNNFRFDDASSSWVMDDAHDYNTNTHESSYVSTNMNYSNHDVNWDIRGRSRTSSEHGRSMMPTSRQLVEEHGLVLAIQAAHMAAQRRHGGEALSRSNSGDGPGTDNNVGIEKNGLGYDGNYHSFNVSTGLSISSYDDSYSSDGFIGMGMAMGRTGSETKSDRQSFKTPAQAFLLVVWMCTCVVLIQGGVTLLLPVWMMSPQDRGGLGYSSVDCGLVLSAVGMWLMHSVDLLRSRLSFVIRASPLRALRVACGCIGLCCLLLPLLLAKSAAEDAENAAVLSKHHNHNADGENPPVGFFPSFYPRPASSPFAIIMPSILVSALICALSMARRAVSILLYTVATPSFSQPQSVVDLVGCYADVLAPCLAGLIFSNSYRKELPYPLDSSTFLLLALCLSCTLYVATLLLNIHFRGDFGIITDEAVVPEQWLSHSSRAPESSKLSQVWNKFVDYFNVPMSDLGLLFSPGLAGYNARMQNLKIDQKDS